jgi:hypothetical protein
LKPWKPKSLPRATRRSKVVAEDHKEAKVVAEGHKEAKPRSLPRTTRRPRSLPWATRRPRSLPRATRIPTLLTRATGRPRTSSEAYMQSTIVFYIGAEIPSVRRRIEISILLLEYNVELYMIVIVFYL